MFSKIIRGKKSYKNEEMEKNIQINDNKKNEKINLNLNFEIKMIIL